MRVVKMVLGGLAANVKDKPCLTPFQKLGVKSALSAKADACSASKMALSLS